MSKTAKSGKAKKVNKSDAPICILTRGRDADAVHKMVLDFLAGKKVNLNAGLYTEVQWDKMVAEYKEAIKDERKVPALPPLYNPAVIQIAHKMGASFVMKGQAKKQPKAPKDWNKAWGEHRPGFKVDSMRLNHFTNVRHAVGDVKEDIITFGKFDYILGIFAVNSARSGNGEANIKVSKEQVCGKLKEANYLVGQINNAALKARLEPKPTESIGPELNVLPDTWITWGYLQKGGKNLTLAQIGKTSNGVKFVPLKEPIIGEGMSEDVWWREVKREMSLASTKDDSGKTAMQRWEDRTKKRKSKKTVRELGWGNFADTQKRQDPDVSYCFGFRSVAVGIPLFIHYAKDTTTTDNPLINFAISARRIHCFSENAWTIKSRTKVAKPKRESTKKVTAKNLGEAPDVTSSDTAKTKTAKTKTKTAKTKTKEAKTKKDEVTAAATTDLANPIGASIDSRLLDDEVPVSNVVVDADAEDEDAETNVIDQEQRDAAQYDVDMAD